MSTTSEATESHTSPPPTDRDLRFRPRRWRRRAGRTIAALLVAAVAGAGLQGFAEQRHAAAHPAPGELLELADGRTLHLQVAGEEHDSPTVLLFSGAGTSVSAWGRVLPSVAEHTTVVAYDRPGLGWSDPSEAGTSAEAVLADLREALELRGIGGPYVLVGHSLGGHHARAFASAYPNEVAGIVLVDPSHEHQSETLDISPASMAPMLTLARAATAVGLTRL